MVVFMLTPKVRQFNDMAMSNNMPRELGIMQWLFVNLSGWGLGAKIT